MTASKADWHIPIRPGGDMALALAVIHYIFEKNLHDEMFCKAWVLVGKNGKFYPQKGLHASMGSQFADISVDQIYRLAEEIAHADGCIIYGSRGINQHMNSTQSNRVLMFLGHNRKLGTPWRCLF